MSGIESTLLASHEPVEASAVFTDHVVEGCLTGYELVAFFESDCLAQLVPERRVVVVF